MRYINIRLTYLLTYLLTYSLQWKCMVFCTFARVTRVNLLAESAPESRNLHIKFYLRTELPVREVATLSRTHPQHGRARGASAPLPVLGHRL